MPNFPADGMQTTHLLPAFVLEPPGRGAALELGELWRYRELLYFLIWRDVKVRYKQTLLGIGWVILQPFLTMVVFSIFFGKLGNIPSNGIPYPIFAFAALLPWQLFSNAVAFSGNSLVLNQGLITKVYFPRLLVPCAAVCVGLVDFGVAFLVLLAMMYYYAIYPTIAMLVLPALILLALLAALATGLWLSALNVRYRDVQYTIPFLTQFWLFATPIAYPSSLVPQQWRLLYNLNPMVGIIDGFRWALLGQERPMNSALLLATIMVIGLLISGLVYFKRMETSFADVV